MGAYIDLRFASDGFVKHIWLDNTTILYTDTKPCHEMSDCDGVYVFANVLLSPGMHQLSFDVYDNNEGSFGLNVDGDVSTSNHVNSFARPKCIGGMQCAYEELPGELGRKATTGLNKTGLDELTVFPNPGQHIFGFSRSVNLVVVTDLLGREIARASDVKAIDGSSWNDGVYIFTIDDGDATVSKMVIKE